MVTVQGKIFGFGREESAKTISELGLEFAEYLNRCGVLSVLKEGNLSGEDLSLVLGTRAINPSKPNQHLESGKIYLAHKEEDWYERDRDNWKVFYVNPMDWNNISKNSKDMGVFYIDLNRLQEWQGEYKDGDYFFKGRGGWQQAQDEIGLVTSSGNYKTLFGDGSYTFWEVPASPHLGVFNWMW